MARLFHWLTFFWFITAGCMSFAGSSNAGEPNPLAILGEHELTGLVEVGDRQIAIKLFDRDQNGVFDDPADRLFLDLDGDGRFHPLKERFAVSQTLRLRDLGETDHYELMLLQDPWRVRLIPIHGTGEVQALLSSPADVEFPDAELTEMTATLVSRSGLHREINQLDQPISLPVGQYRIESLGLEFRGDRRWSIAFSNFNKNLDYLIEVRPDTVTSFELLGKLTLSARVIASALAAGRLTIQPTLVSESGLTLIRSRIGQQTAAEDNQLIASLIHIGKDKQESAIDVKGTGFACGQFCPIELTSRQRMVPGMLVALQFDAGPLGGPMFVITTLRPPGQPAIEAGSELLDFSK
jgi:hypothetical protein